MMCYKLMTQPVTASLFGHFRRNPSHAMRRLEKCRSDFSKEKKKKKTNRKKEAEEGMETREKEEANRSHSPRHFPAQLFLFSIAFLQGLHLQQHPPGGEWSTAGPLGNTIVWWW